MKSITTVAFVLSFGASVVAADRKDELFKSWEQARDRMESLVVEFDRESMGPSDKPEKAKGMLRVLRTKDGNIYASYQLFLDSPDGQGISAFEGLYHSGAFYVILDPNKKFAVRFNPENNDSTKWLEKNCNPFVQLLNRKRAEEKNTIDAVKEEEWYIYITMTPKGERPTGWFPDRSFTGQIAIMNKDTKSIPKNMPRSFEYWDIGERHRYEITKWQLNAADGPKLEEFTKPEDRPGWEVKPWPFGSKKK